MSITPYQIITPLLSCIAILYAWNLQMRQKKTAWEAVLLTLFWGALAIIAIEPGLLAYLTAVTGIKDQANAVLVTLIGILFFLVFYLVLRIEELERRQTQIVRNSALREAGLERQKE